MTGRFRLTILVMMQEVIMWQVNVLTPGFIIHAQAIASWSLAV